MVKTIPALFEGKFTDMTQNIDEEVQPLEVLHEAQQAAQNKYNDTLTQAQQDRDEAIAAAQKQYAQDLKAYNAAIEAASRG